MADAGKHSKRCWFTFPTPQQVEQPIIWQMCRKFPDVMFDIRQASVQKDIGIMAVLFSGDEDEIEAALKMLTDLGVKVDPVEGGSLVAG